MIMKTKDQMKAEAKAMSPAEYKVWIAALSYDEFVEHISDGWIFDDEGER